MDKLTPEGRFQHCLTSILEHEGGLSKNKNDPGGTTQWGVSLRFLKATGLDIDLDGDIDEDDVIAITPHDAENIYRKYWWDKYRYSGFNELEVVEKVFDLAVNMGGKAAHKLLQIAINRLREQPITVDGLLGGQTFRSANGLDGNQLRQELRECAKHKYIQILADRPAMEWCRNGWMNRAAW